MLYTLISGFHVFQIRRNSYLRDLKKKGGHQIRENTCRNFTIPTLSPPSSTIFHTSNKYAHIPSARYQTRSQTIIPVKRSICHVGCYLFAGIAASHRFCSLTKVKCDINFPRFRAEEMQRGTSRSEAETFRIPLH